jgi:CrcB protein
MTAQKDRQRRQELLHRLRLYAAVGAGSVIGGTARWLISELLLLCCPAGLPWGTLFVNVTGSLLIGFYAALTGPDGRVFAGPVQRQFVMTGICGGYTTFSIFSLETVRLIEAGALAMAGLNVAVSLVLWLVAAWIGFAAATWLNRLP